VEDDILEMVEHSPSVSVRRVSNRVRDSRMTVWRTVHDYGFYPFHVQNVQALRPNDYFARENFCNWLLRNQELFTKMLFTDEAIFSRDGITNTRYTHVWSNDNPHATKETHFQTLFSVNFWWGIIRNLLIGPVVLEDHLTSQRYLRFLQEELPLMCLC
jgi:hypothetical protein